MRNIHDEARAALDAKAAAEVELAAAAYCPPWRHAVFGLVMGVLVLMPAATTPVRMAILAAALVSIALIVRADRRRTGMFVNGYRRGKTRIVALVLVAAVLLLNILSARAGAAGETSTVFLLAGVAFVASTIGSVVWQRIFVRELGA